MAAKAFSRKGLHRLECPMCPCYGYFTVGMLETAGQLPACFGPGCSETLQPIEVELAELLGLEDCGAVDEYRREIESIWHGQEAHAARLDRTLRDPHELAMSRIVKRRRDDARTRRVKALQPVQPAMPF